MPISTLHSLLKTFRSIRRGALSYIRRKVKNVRVAGLQIFYGSRLRLIARGDEVIGRPFISREVIVKIGGRSAFRRIRKLIRRSRASIVIQAFIWKDDETGREIARNLLEAAERGVKVYIAKEAVGDFFEFDESFSATQNSRDPVWRAFWNQENITIAMDGQADHSKVWIFDARIVLLTGMNIASEYEHKLHDFLIELRGENFAQQVLERATSSVQNESKIRIVMNNQTTFGIRPCVSKLLHDAKDSVIIEHCYLSDPGVLQEIAAATKRGVKVNIIIPSASAREDRANEKMLVSLGKICDKRHLFLFKYPRRFHSKILLVDKMHCLVGSANLNTLSLERTGEVCALLSGTSRAVKKIERRLKIDILRSRMF